jgi:hypothetical protein
MGVKSHIRNIKTILFPGAPKPTVPSSPKKPARFDAELKNRILVGTHHKAGTVWLLSVFRRISRQFGLTFCRGAAPTPPQDFDVFFRCDSHFDLGQVQAPYRGLHIIRDPRDMIVSGCFYHQQSKEEWLHIKQDRFGGLTYQEKINSYQSLDDQILFEMEHVGQQCIQQILAWDFDDPAFFEVQYEDLISDEQLVLFHSIFAFLGFPGKAMPQVLKIAFENSVFSGTLKRTTHIRSGKKRQWEEHFNAHHRARFLEIFGDALQRLGYENSDAWADETPTPTIQAAPTSDVRRLRLAA